MSPPAGLVDCAVQVANEIARRLGIPLLDCRNSGGA